MSGQPAAEVSQSLRTAVPARRCIGIL